MPAFMQAAAAIAVIIVGYIGLNLAFTNPAPGSVAGTIDTSSWATYVSDRYGFSIGYPEDWAIEHQSEEDWAMDGGTEQRGFETFSGTGDDMATVGVSAWSAAVEPGIAADVWIESYCWRHASPCTAIEERSEPVTIDGHPGSLVSFDTPQAFVPVDDRMYVVAIWRPESDPSLESYGGATRLLKGFLSTMELLP